MLLVFLVFLIDISWENAIAIRSRGSETVDWDNVISCRTRKAKQMDYVEKSNHIDLHKIFVIKPKWSSRDIRSRAKTNRYFHLFFAARTRIFDISRINCTKIISRGSENSHLFIPWNGYPSPSVLACCCHICMVIFIGLGWFANCRLLLLLL